MAQYENKFDFVKRTIQIYRLTNKNLEHFCYTQALGVILNIVSVIFPENVNENSNLDEKILNICCKKEFPNNFGRGIDNMRTYMKILRNGLAHKNEVNFVTSSNEGSVSEIELTCRQGNGHTLTLTIEDLNSIINLFEDVINQYTSNN